MVQGACNIISKQLIRQSDNPQKKKAELAEEYRLKLANPYVAAPEDYIDKVIEPEETRTMLSCLTCTIIRFQNKDGN